jgi:hypothetical protein
MRPPVAAALAAGTVVIAVTAVATAAGSTGRSTPLPSATTYESAADANQSF